MSFSLAGVGSSFQSATGSLLTATFPLSLGAIPAGSLVVINHAVNVAGLTFTCADNSTQAGAANVYISLTPVAGATFTGVTIYCITTRAMLTTDTVTVTYSAVGSRHAGLLLPFTPSNGNPALDKTAIVQNAVASPVNSAATGTLSSASDLSVMGNFWKGGAVGSGFSATGTGAVGNAALSGGTTTNVETHTQHTLNLGATTSITSGAAYTSITAGCGSLATFTDSPFVLSPVTTRLSRALSLDRAVSGLSRVSGVFGAGAAAVPDTIAPVAVARQSVGYRGSYSQVMGAADQFLGQDYAAAPLASRQVAAYRAPLAQVRNVFDPAANTFADWTPGLILSRRQPGYQAPLGRTIIASDQAAIPGTFVAAIVSRISQLYRAPLGLVLNVFDPALNTFADWAPTTLTRRAGRYEPQHGLAFGVFDNPTVAGGTDFVPGTQSRPSQLYRGSYSLVIGAADDAFTPGATDWAQVTQGYRRPARYLGSASLTIPVWDPATATYRDWAPAATMSRAAFARLLRSLTTITADNLAADQWAPAAMRQAPPQRAWARSLTVGAFDNATPDAYTPGVTQSRRLPTLLNRSANFALLLGPFVVIVYPTGGGGYGAEVAPGFLQRYEPRYRGLYRPGYKPTLRKQR